MEQLLQNTYLMLTEDLRIPKRQETPHIPGWVADRVLVLQPGVRPELLRWESRVQDTGKPETSRPHVISNSKGLSEISISMLRPSSLNDQQATVLNTLCQTDRA